MNIREREIILRLRSGDPRVRNRQVEDLFYRKGAEGSLQPELNKVISFCFQGPKYAGLKEELYNTLVTLVLKDVDKASDETMLGIEKTLKGYFFQMARNCANRERKYIDRSLGINDMDVSLDREGRRPLVGEDPWEETEDDLLSVLLFGEDHPAEDQPRRKVMACMLLERYMAGIKVEDYRKILYAIDIEEWPHDRIERELQIKDIDQTHRRAKLALIRAALPDIRKHCSDYYAHHRGDVSPAEADLLDRFFGGESKVPGKKVAEAYSNLLKVVRREKKDLLKAKKQSIREEKAALKAEKEKEKKKARRKRPPKTDSESE